MGILVHHQPANKALSWRIHLWQSAWDGNIVQDTPGMPGAETVDFHLPDAPDPRKLQFKFHSTDVNGQDTWEADDFARRLFLTSTAEVWTFERSPRII